VFGICLATIVVAASGCKNEPVAETSLLPLGTHWMVVVDRSGSRTFQQMEELRSSLNSLLGGISFGDKATVLQVMEAGTDRVEEFIDSVNSPRSVAPSKRELIQREAALGTMRSVAQRFADTTGIGAIRTTDLLQSFRRIAEYAKFSGRRERRLVVFSDMIHSVPGMHFEDMRQIPGAEWLEEQAREGLLPRLDGVCVFVIGADPGTVRAKRLEGFWREYFIRARARVPKEKFLNRLLPTQELHC
jgi:hypothetical protein